MSLQFFNNLQLKITFRIVPRQQSLVRHKESSKAYMQFSAAVRFSGQKTSRREIKIFPRLVLNSGQSAFINCMEFLKCNLRKC